MIIVKNLSKEFKVHKKIPGLLGSMKALIHREWIIKKALDNVSFSINPGEIIGLIGPNGAGKTTLAKILSGIVHPSSGQASVVGHTPWERSNLYRQQMSLIMGQKASLWWDLPAHDCYLLLKEIYQISDKNFNSRLEYLSHSLGIKNELNVQIRRLSLGERMKVELIAALLHNPKVIFLDEPTIGLDLTAQKAIRNFLLEYKKQYKPIMILTSHYMKDIEQLCERIMILRQGAIIYDGPLKKITDLYGEKRTLTFHLHNDQSFIQKIEEAFPKHLGEISIENNSIIKIQTHQKRIADIVSYMNTNSTVHDLSVKNINVADIIEKIQNSGLSL